MVVFQNAVLDISYLVPNVLDVQRIVLVVLQIINAIIVKMVSIFTEVLVTVLVQLVQLPIKILSNVSHVMLHAELALIIQAHVLVVNQEKDSYKLQELIKNVLNNVLKELSLKTEFVKFATSDVLNVWEPQETVLLAQPTELYITLLVGTTAQVLLMLMENVLINASLDISDSQINNVENVPKNVKPVITIQHV